MWFFQTFLVITGVFLVQAALVPHISIMGVKPDLLLILGALYGFMHGPQIGSCVGFTAGLLGDLLDGAHVGLGLLSKSIVGFFAGLVQRTIFVENIVLPMLAIFVATGLHEFVYLGFSFLLGETVPLKPVILKIVLPTALYNSLLTPLVYAAVHRFMVIKQQDTVAIRVPSRFDIE